MSTVNSVNNGNKILEIRFTQNSETNEKSDEIDRSISEATSYEFEKQVCYVRSASASLIYQFEKRIFYSSATGKTIQMLL